MDASVAQCGTPFSPSRRKPVFAGAACARRHRAITSRRLPVCRAPTSYGRAGSPAPSCRRQPSRATFAVSAVRHSLIGALRAIVSPSPLAVSTSPTIFSPSCSMVWKIDQTLRIGSRKVMASRALSRRLGCLEITPRDSIRITIRQNGRRAVLSATSVSLPDVRCSSVRVQILPPGGHFAVKQIDEMWNLHGEPPPRRFRSSSGWRETRSLWVVANLSRPGGNPRAR